MEKVSTQRKCRSLTYLILSLRVVRKKKTIGKKKKGMKTRKVHNIEANAEEEEDEDE